MANQILAIDKTHLCFANSTKGASLVLRDPADLDLFRTDVLVEIYNNSVTEENRVKATAVSHADIIQKLMKFLIENPVTAAGRASFGERKDKRVYRAKSESVQLVIDFISNGKPFKVSDIAELLGCKHTTAAAMLATIRNRNGDYKVPIRKISPAGEEDVFLFIGGETSMHHKIKGAVH